MTVTVAKNNLPAVRVNGVRSIGFIVRKEAFDIERDMKRSMRGAKHGIVYYRGPNRRPHRASAPGETPARDSGDLVNSIRVLTPAPETAQVVIGVEYAGYLEYGTRHMEPRPFVVPAVERARLRLSRTHLGVEMLINGPPSL